jgi:transcriptional regulator GlxA family with amidase domain
MANQIGSVRVPYRTQMVTPGGRPITFPTGLTLQGGPALERVTGPFDTVLVSGGWGHEQAAANPLIVAHVRRIARESRRIASVCTGAGILAAAGLLDGRRVTTHWRWAGELAARHPSVTVDPDPIHIRDGNLTTSAGVTSALDLSMALTHLGQPPGHFVRHARSEAAAHLLTGTSLPMHGVAARCGFGSAETLRQAFVGRYGITPSRYRSAHTRGHSG